LKNFLKALLLLALIGLIAWVPFALYEAMRVKAAEIDASRMRARDALPVLRVGVMQHPTVYFIDANDQPAGLEHDLVSAFAITQRSEVEWIAFRTPADARAALARGELDIVAIGTSAAASNGNAPHSPIAEAATQTKFHQSAWVLLHTPNKLQPDSFAQLSPMRVVVSSRIFTHPRFEAIVKQNPNIEFVVDARNDDETLMAAVGDDEVPYAIVEEDTFSAARHFHYDTQRAFVVHPPLQRSWLFRKDAESLRDEADRFLSRIVREGQITRVLDRYFGFPASRRQEDFEIFSERVTSLLPRYRQWFQEAQDRYGIEWRLLAAIAYQESHWNADATSETGVRGIMQFTEDTAKRFGVDRLDPHSSILGGARYIDDLKKNSIPPRVNEPDKTWLALAAYNIGIGHVENARILTQQSRKNPDSWSDVRRHLPLLAKPDVASRFKLGPCRCVMPVEFVEAVRAYYDVLLRLEPPHQGKLKVQEKS
jgi:membrane-bound lytic murein transglycosylase F